MIKKPHALSRRIYWLTVVFLFLPLAVLMLYSFNASRSFKFSGFSIKWYYSLFSRWIAPEKIAAVFPELGARELAQIVERSKNIWTAVRNSFAIAFATGLVSTVIGALGAIGLSWYRFSYKKFLQGVSFVPLLLPEIITGVSLLIFFSSILRLKLSLITVLIGHISFCLPFVLLIIIARLEEFDYSIIEAARDLGARERDILFRIILPISAPGILAGFVGALTLSLEDFVVTVFVQGANSPTLPVFIHSLIKRGVPPEINALSVFLILFTVVLILSIRNFIKYIGK
ncbi:MAG: ABC transporter permease [Spirochaetales bacterium]|jgi:spermidine/putrescine transport system permease protein|nr:ABC transporter permease [Spirochaetales bacterium]